MEELRRIRLAAGMTQVELASRAGIAPANLSAMETGARRPSPAMRDRIVAATGLRRPSQVLARHRDEVLDLIHRLGGVNPRVFGSVARQEDTVLSDLDLLITPMPGRAWDFCGLKPALSELLGITVDVVPDTGLRTKHQKILREAVPV